MNELIVFPDHIALGVDEIKSALAEVVPGLEVSGKVAHYPAGEFIRLRALGGSRESLITQANLVAVEAYAGSEARAHELCGYGVAVLLSLDGALYGGRENASPQDLPDPDTTQDRATATVQIRVRGTSLA